MKARHSLLARLLVVGLLGAARVDAETSAPERALASRLFDDASKLMAQGQTPAACDKYAESERLDPQLGTLLHLGECYAKVGKTASAWASFKEAADLAAQRKDPRSTKIRERLARLEKSLSELIIVVADSEPTTLEVRQDGALVGRPAWGTPIPVDPGEHAITATAPGAKPREVKAIVSQAGQTMTVRLPPIEALPAPSLVASSSQPSATPSPPAARGSTPEAAPAQPPKRQRLAAVIVGGVGVVGIGIGATFGLLAKSSYDKSKAHCNGDHCDSAGHDDRSSAFSQATVSNIAWGVGGAALLGGAVLWFTAPKGAPNEPRPTALLLPSIGPNLASLTVQRSW